jgi:tetratricopeptide (TPR) repeat protein
MKMRASLVVILAGGLALAGCQQAAEPPQQAQLPKAAPKPKRMMTITSKSPEAVAAYERGRDLMENVRQAEAMEQLRQAVALDPDFALATADLGTLTPGADGLAMVQKAESMSATLPPAEKMSIQAMLAQEQGDAAHALELTRQVASAAPDDWHVQLQLGEALAERRMLDEASQALTKATQLEPKAGPAWNALGYVSMRQRKFDDAIAALQKYAEINPTEPNPKDSLAEAYLMAGRLDESEKSFQDAVTTSASFYPAWLGIAQVRGLRGDWKGSMEAVGKAKAAATRPQDALETDFDMAWVQFAKGDTAAATKTLDGLGTAASTAGFNAIAAFAPADRARILVLAGKPMDALKQLDIADTRASEGNLPGGAAWNVARASLSTRVSALAALKKMDDAKAALVKLQAEAAKMPDSEPVQALVHVAEGEIALASGDAAGAVTHFSNCADEEYYCRYMLANAQEKAGDKSAATATRAALATANLREPGYLWFHVKVAAAATETAGQ